MIPARPKLDLRQDELALASVAVHTIYPGRRTIRIAEFAHDFSITEQQVIDLIVCGDLMGVNISAARDLAGGGLPSTEMTREQRRSVRRVHWRIPLSSYDKFVQERKSR